MTLTQLASHYLVANLLLIGATGASLFLFFVNRKFALVSARYELKFNYALLSLVMALSFVQIFLPKQEFFKPPAKVWSASSSAGFAKDFSADLGKGYMSLDFISSKPVINTQMLNSGFWLVAILILIFGLYRLTNDVRALMRITRQSFLIRKIGSVKIYSSDAVKVPFSFWLPRTHAVVIPNSMLGTPDDMKMAILHELQHHRQKDTQWIHFLWIAKILFSLNPAIYLWNRLFLEIQEFACDEALVDQSKVSSKAYASCLVRVAQTAVSQEQSFVCATGLTFMADRHSLKRRIETMMLNKTKRMNRFVAASIASLIFVGLTGVAFASQGLIQDRRVTLKDAKGMLASIKGDDGFQVVVNDLVLKQLNRYVGTPEGREHMRKSLARMESYKAMVVKNLTDYGVPQVLLAIPIIESGYQNLAQTPDRRAAGLWMFIPSTARNYGLRVDGTNDDRLNVDLETDAAMRYIVANNARFKSWELSVLAYNVGESKVQEGIDKVGSKDVWALIRNGFENDVDYFSKLMAAILIMNNPSVVE